MEWSGRVIVVVECLLATNCTVGGTQATNDSLYSSEVDHSVSIMSFDGQ
jgi:hypothetical protein